MGIDESRKCFFTGHRIMTGYEQTRAGIITAQLCERLILTRGVDTFISGGAMGYDCVAAEAVLRLKRKYPVKLSLYLPCRDRDVRWSHANKARWRAVEEAADECVYITDGAYTDGCMHKRNRAMADAAEYCIAFWRGGRGGTAVTLDYARERGRETTVITLPGTKLPFGIFEKKYI